MQLIGACTSRGYHNTAIMISVSLRTLFAWIFSSIHTYIPFGTMSQKEENKGDDKNNDYEIVIAFHSNIDRKNNRLCNIPRISEEFFATVLRDEVSGP